MRAYRKSRSEIDELASQVVRREVYVATGEDTLNAFGHLFALMGERPSESQVESIGAVYERMSKASPVALNGHPIFFSCQFVHRSDMKRLRKAVSRKEKALAGRSLINRLFSRRLTASSSNLS